MKSKAHTRYKTESGRIVPGVTTIIGQLNKPALVPWSNRLGLSGIDVTKFVDEKSEIGQLAHRMILDYFRKEKTDTSEYSANQIDAAENSLLSFHEWEKHHKLEPILLEEALVSETYLYGGTFDFYGLVDDGNELIDFKTGSGIYREYWYQTSGYCWLLKEIKDFKPTKVRILNIPRTEDESFKEEVNDIQIVEKYLKGFLKLVEFYHNDKGLK